MTSEWTDLLPLEGSKSDVWKHFGFPARDGKFLQPDKKSRKEVICKMCHKCLKYCGNTTNLHFHLKEHHHRIYLSLKDNQSSIQAPKTDTGNQRTLAQAVLASQKLPQTSPSWSKLTDSICYFIAKDMQLLDTVEDTGFFHLLQSFEPRYDPPSRKTITTKYLPQMFEGEKMKIMHHLSDVRVFLLQLTFGRLGLMMPILA